MLSLPQYDLFVGLDPGAKGAVALLDDQGCAIMVEDVHRYPETLLGLLRRFYGYSTNPSPRIAACIERVGSHKGDGAAAMFSFGTSFGVAWCALHTISRPEDVGLIHPATWKKAMKLTRKGKAGSVALASMLFPALGCLRHDQAEALLLARFAFLNRDRWPEVCKEISSPRLSESLREGKKKKPPKVRRAKAHQEKDSEEDIGVLVL